MIYRVAMSTFRFLIYLVYFQRKFDNILDRLLAHNITEESAVISNSFGALAFQRQDELECQSSEIVTYFNFFTLKVLVILLLSWC